MDSAEAERLRRFEALSHSSAAFVAIATTTGNIEYVNPAGRRLVGLGEDVDIEQLVTEDFLTGEAAVQHLEVERPAVLGGREWHGENTLRDWHGGAPIPVSVHSFVIRDVRTDEPIAMATIQRDLRESIAAQLALAESQERQSALLLHMSDVLVVIAADHTVTYSSPSANRALGYPDDSLMGWEFLELVHPEDRASAAQALALIAAQPGESDPIELRLRGADGSARDYEALANNLFDDRSVGGIVIVARDLTDRNRARSQQAAQAEVLELIARGESLDVVLTAIAGWVEGQLENTKCTILLVDKHTTRPTVRVGAAPSLPESYRRAVDGLPLDTACAPCALAITTTTSVLVPDLLADPQWAPFHDLATTIGLRSCWSFPVLSPASEDVLGSFALYRSEVGHPEPDLEVIIGRANHLIGIAVDRQELTARLAQQALHDALTGLPNRVQLLQRLTSDLQRQRVDPTLPPPVLIFLDLDRLKIVNDSLGHELGDELLIHTARRLESVAGADALVARFGGDEFAVIVGSLATQDAAREYAERVLDVIADPLELADRKFTPSASAGVVMAEVGQTASGVMRDADIAMYRAKNRGGSGYELFSSTMRQRAFDRLDLEQQVRHGLVNNEFRVYYQPIVDLTHADCLVGFEALVRWQHPERGLLEPGSFIALAEETGLIGALGEWVLSTTADTVHGWGEELPGRPLQVSVNVAAQQLAGPGLVAAVKEAVAQVGDWSLVLELTESTLIGETPTSQGVIDELVGTGVQLSIDDFGTGYSSLSYLTKLPVQILKIDRSFIAELGETNEANSVATLIIRLSEALGLRVVAEGIETPDQRAILVKLGCRFAQGYLFDRPLPEDQAHALLLRSAHQN